jgi:two-component system sensor histidine kinase KdpD
MLSAVSGAVERMARQPDHVPAIAVQAVIGLGLDAGAFQALDEDSVSHHLLESEGFDDDPERVSSVSGAMTDRVLQRGETVVARIRPDEGEVQLPDSGHGFVAAVASPIWVEGWVAAVLIGAARSDARLSREAVEAFGLLVTQAGLMLDNAQLVAEEQQIAGRLEAGDRLKTDFLTTISHELRTPLTVLMGNGITLETTWDDLDERGRRELLSAMNASGRVLDEMLTNLLDYARMEAGELWVTFEPFDISSVVRKECARCADAPGDRYVVTRIEDDLLVSGDVPLIRRLVSALLKNASTHTPPGTTVTASCRRRTGEVVVEIADDGPGILDEDMPFLGERFFRGGETNARPRGLGLGLALARGILELHRSELVVEKAPEGGMRFRFSLPWVPDPTVPPTDEANGSTHAPYAPDHGRA